MTGDYADSYQQAHSVECAAGGAIRAGVTGRRDMISAQGIWLALLLPTSLIGVLCLPRDEARQLGRRLLAAGLLSGLSLFAWGMANPSRQSAAEVSVDRLSAGFHEVVDTSIVPSIPLAAAGCICLLATGFRRSDLQ